MTCLLANPRKLNPNRDTLLLITALASPLYTLGAPVHHLSLHKSKANRQNQHDHRHRLRRGEYRFDSHQLNFRTIRPVNSARRNLQNYPTDEDEFYLPDLGIGATDEGNKIELPDSVFASLFGAGKSADWGEGDGSDNVIGVENNVVTGSYSSPVYISTPSVEETDFIVGVSSGDFHSVILTHEGRVLTAGLIADEQRGMGRAILDSSIGGSGEGATSNIVGENTLLYGFHPITEAYYFDSSTPSPPPKFTKIFASQSFSFALDSAGRAWSTGINNDGRLCLGDLDSRARFHQIHDLGAPIVNIALGDRHTLLLREDGSVFVCGWNTYGQLGLGTEEDVMIPTQVPMIKSENGSMELIEEISAGRGTSYFRTLNGAVYSTGTNFEGQLCLGHREDRTIPTPITKFPSDISSSVEHITSGKTSLYLLMGDGSVLSCGGNVHGQLGDGTTENKENPTPVKQLRDVTRMFSGATATNAFFLSHNGTVFGVGYNGSGQLGVGDTDSKKVATAVACTAWILDDWAFSEILGESYISSGNDHTLFLGTGEAYCQYETTAEPTGPTVSPNPSLVPSRSIVPTVSAAPSISPTTTAVPTHSAMPSTVPTTTSRPTLSSSPSEAPSLTPLPSVASTDAPSLLPSVSTLPTLSSSPSSVPTTSMQPTVSALPSSAPTVSLAPTVTSAPSLHPSVFVSGPPTTSARPSTPQAGASPGRQLPIPNGSQRTDFLFGWDTKFTSFMTIAALCFVWQFL